MGKAVRRSSYEAREGVRGITVRFVTGYDGDNKPIRAKARFPLGTAKKDIELWVSSQKLKYKHDDTLTVTSKITFGEVCQMFLESKKGSIETNTYNEYERNIRLHLTSLKTKEVRKIKTTDIQNLLNTKKDKSTRFSQYLKTLLSMIFNYAIKQGLTSSNPVKGAIVAKVQRKKQIHVIPPSKITEFLESIQGSRFEALFRLLALSGLRIGEALALEVKHISENAVTVEQSLDSLYTFDIGKPKTSHSFRTVTITKDLIKDLLTDSRNGYIFERGKYPYKAISKELRAIVKALGMPDITIHSLRHSHSVYLLSKGVPVLAVSKRLGHHSPAFTLERYGHLVPEMSEGIVGILETL
jgi:integrase